jgi:hypothetical protein
MSKRINVNPGQYKTKGRERPGDDVVHQDEPRKRAAGKEDGGSGPAQPRRRRPARATRP